VMSVAGTERTWIEQTAIEGPETEATRIGAAPTSRGDLTTRLRTRRVPAVTRSWISSVILRSGYGARRPR
jgi:hypothetical protein